MRETKRLAGAMMETQRSGHARFGKQSMLDAGSRLAERIENQIVPQLLGERAPFAIDERDADRLDFDERMITQWAELAVDDDVPALAEHFRAVLATEADLATVFLGILAPVARLLGQWGDMNRISFAEVDRSISTLEDVIQKFNHDHVPHATRGWRMGSILLSTCPGDEHSFGLRMVEELFRRDGWSLTSLVARSNGMITSELGRNHFHVLGLSIARASMLPNTALLVKEARAASLNPDLLIVLGGPAITEETLAEAQALGADFVAQDATTAIDAIRARLPEEVV
jgi:MerR family transcriptional regulator, light-induced transcriptional regulator